MDEHLNIDWLVSDKIGLLDCMNPVESPEVLKQLECEGHTQVVTVSSWPVTMAWRLPDSDLRNCMFRATRASALSQRVLSRLNEFCVYELAHGRRVPIWFEDDCVRDSVAASITGFFSHGSADLDGFVAQAMATQRDRYAQFPHEPAQYPGCDYCHEGLCYRDIVCHTTTVQSAVEIIRGGSILSACRAFGLPGEEIARDPRNAAGDPADYFEYVMFGPGNCSAVDKLVYERVIGHVPSWEEFETNFQPGVRFYFRADDLRSHPDFTFDGFHEKIRDGLELDPWLVAVVVPEDLDGADELMDLARHQLPADKVVSLPHDGVHYKDWAQNACREAESRNPINPR